MEMEKILKKVEEDKVRFVLLQFTDINGIVKNLTIPVKRLKEAIEDGVWIDGSSVHGFLRVHESDMYLKPVVSTYTVIPWLKDEDNENTARIICDLFTPNGDHFEDDLRYILKKVLKEASDMGLNYFVGPEPEFFLFNNENGFKPLPHDMGGYFDLNMDKAFSIRSDMTKALEEVGIEVETNHHEVAYGQHEIAFKYDEALKTADNIITFKFTLKAIAEKNGLHATFMPKPISGINGSGMHCHQSLFTNEGKNAFYDENDPYHLSATAKSFIAGQLKYITEMSGVVAPLVNSYKRLVPGYEAPVYVCWAKINRSALIRIPRFSEGKKNSCRAEIRCPDPSSNPYLALAVLLKAGLKGIKENLVPADPVEEDVYHFDNKKLNDLYIKTLPASLGEAINEMKKGSIVKETFGESLFNKFIESRQAEWDEYRLQVNDWEIKKYIEKY